MGRTFTNNIGDIMACHGRFWGRPNADIFAFQQFIYNTHYYMYYRDIMSKIEIWIWAGHSQMILGISWHLLDRFGADLMPTFSIVGHLYTMCIKYTTKILRPKLENEYGLHSRKSYIPNNGMSWPTSGLT
jgi:hypothetical protein